MMVIVKNLTKIFTNLRIVLNIVLIQLDSQGVPGWSMWSKTAVVNVLEIDKKMSDVDRWLFKFA